MQPVRLILENFGPYENSLIDFSDYYRQSLFLITGKTGAGKTTIFDGMSYALYGSTSGGLRQGKEMRSNFAELGQKTKVTFVFKQNGKTYEIEREPEQLVNKLRGEGVREQPAGVCLTIYDENKNEINQLTKQKDVGIFLNDLIQLNEQQFSQIVMLPQGEFRRFLIADSDSKEKVLRKLFNTYFYQDIAEFLRQKKKNQESSLKEVKQELTVHVNQLEFQPDFLQEDISDWYYQDITELYKDQQKAYQEEINKLSKELTALQQKRKDHQTQIHQEQKLLEQFLEQETVFNQLDLLKEQAESITLKKQQIALLTNLQKIEPTYNYLNELMIDKEKVINQEESFLAEQKANTTQLEIIKEKQALLMTKEASMNEYQKILAKIETSIPLFEKKKNLEINLNTLKAELIERVSLKEQLAEQEKKLTVEKIAIETLQASKFDLLAEKVALDKEKSLVSNQFDTIKNYEKEQSLLKDKQKTLTNYQEQLIVVTKEWQTTVQRQKQLKSDWAKAQIAKLSLDLIDGEACPVCGSKEHPNIFHGETITKEDMEQLEQSLESAEEQVAATREQVVTLENKIAFVTDELTNNEEKIQNLILQINTYFEVPVNPGDWLTTITNQLIAIQQKEESVQATLADIEAKDEWLLKLKEELVSIESQKDTQEQELRQTENNQLQTETSLREFQEQLPDTWQTLDEMLKEQEQLIQETTTWNQAVTSANGEIDVIKEQLLVLKTSITNEGNKKQELVKKAAREELKVTEFLEKNKLEKNQLEISLAELPKLASLTTEVTDFEKQEYALNEQATKLTALLKEREKPDIDPLLIIEKELLNEEKAKQSALSTIEYQVKSNQKIIETISIKETAMKDSLDALEELTELANVMTGDGPHKLSMERFVLQTYLKRILQRANEKLLVLTNGRYRFELKEEQGSFKKKTGLEINIYDDNAGAIRSVNTLSGGESFIAALSLALSLAEVIQEEAGGIKIDAMFIDEGFGSLDEDALEMAIRALESIEGEGRLIGIISHVRELKERIPQQLQVKATVDGKSYVEERLEFE